MSVEILPIVNLEYAFFGFFDSSIRDPSNVIYPNN